MAKIKTASGVTIGLHPSLGTANAAGTVDVHAIAPVPGGRSNWVFVNGVPVDISDSLITGVSA